MDLAGLFLVAMIAASAVQAGMEKVRRLLEPSPVQHRDWVALAGLIGLGRQRAEGGDKLVGPIALDPADCRVPPVADMRYLPRTRYGTGLWPQVVEDAGMTVLTARADVATETPQRYAKQLLSHLGQRTSWTTDGDTSTAGIAGGTGRVILGEGMLTLIAEAPDTATLARVQHVLGSHLERFGQRNELTVTWVSTSEAVAAPTPPAPSGHDRPGRH